MTTGSDAPQGTPAADEPARWAGHPGIVELPLCGERYRLTTHDLGTISVPSGRLLVGDAAPTLMGTVVLVPPGDLRAVATYAAPLGKHGMGPRISHVSLFVPGRTEVRRGVLPRPLLARIAAEARTGAEPSEWFGVDSGACCCVDEAAYGDGGEIDDLEFLYGDGVPAAIVAAHGGPQAPKAVFCSSGLGDGMYRVVGGFDSDGSLAALHIDFEILDDFDPQEVRARIAASRRKERWSNLGCVVAAVAVVVLLVGLIGLIVHLFPGRTPYVPVYLDPGDPRNLKHGRPR